MEIEESMQSEEKDLKDELLKTEEESRTLVWYKVELNCDKTCHMWMRECLMGWAFINSACVWN